MIETEDREGVRTLTMNRPPSNNLNLELLRRLEEAARAAGRDPTVRAVVLRSAIPKYFSAGLDPQALLASGDGPSREPFDALFGMYRAWLECPKPTVAAVEGYALLGGCILAMSCDFRVLATESGRMSLSEIRLGLSPMPTFLGRLRAIGVTGAGIRELALKGRTLRADEALAVGLVDRVVPAAELVGEARAEAKALARMPPLAYATVKRHLSRAADPELETFWRESIAEFPRLVASPEAKEAVGALGKRRGAAS